MVKRFIGYDVDPETGEVIDISEYAKLRPGDWIFTEKQREFCQNKAARHQDKTDFIWFSFQYGTNLEFPVDPAVAVRFLYFGTACGTDGIIQKKKLMNAKLNMDKNQQTVFLKQTLQSELLRCEGDALVVDTQVISRGEYTADSNRIRVFSGYYRMLCESAKSQPELKRIYYFLQMIPYLNRQSNILSHNQIEQDPERVVNMSFNEFCKKIGYNVAHASKLKKQLSSFRVNGELVVGFFDDISELTQSGSNVVLNPKLFFGGDRTIGTYKTLCALFENEKSNYISANGRVISEGDA